MGTLSKLETLVDLYEELKKITALYDTTRDGVIPEDVKLALNGVDEEFGKLLETAQERIRKLEEEVKKDILISGTSQSVKGLKAQFVSGRITWDTSKMDGYMAAHPEIEQFRKVGMPSVRLIMKEEKDGDHI
jgi:hypothetical protein